MVKRPSYNYKKREMNRTALLYEEEYKVDMEETLTSFYRWIVDTFLFPCYKHISLSTSPRSHTGLVFVFIFSIQAIKHFISKWKVQGDKCYEKPWDLKRMDFYNWQVCFVCDPCTIVQYTKIYIYTSTPLSFFNKLYGHFLDRVNVLLKNTNWSQNTCMLWYVLNVMHWF